MSTIELAPHRAGGRDAASRAGSGAAGGGVLVDAFEERALAVAAAAAAPNTRRAYATAYRGFAGFLRATYGEASTATFTLAAVAAWRDHLVARGLAPASVAQRVCAVRGLAVALGSDLLVQRVRCPSPGRERPPALSDLELSNLLCRPDRRTRIGVRDRAVLELLARAGLRRSEVARLELGDVREQGRQGDTRRRAAVAPARGDQSPLEVVVRGSKRGRTRTVPLHSEAVDALRRWYASRPQAAEGALFVSLQRRTSARPQRLSPGAIGDIVARHAEAAGVREDRRTAHALRHTFCTMLAERDVALEVIAELAGHVDVRTTRIYVAVSDERKARGIRALERSPHPLAAPGWGRGEAA